MWLFYKTGFQKQMVWSVTGLDRLQMGMCR